MACILLTEMDPVTSSPTAHSNGHHHDTDPVAGLYPKQDMDAVCLTLHLYYVDKDGGGTGAKDLESVLTFPLGEYVAEELCVSAAKMCGESQEDLISYVFPHIIYLLLM